MPGLHSGAMDCARIEAFIRSLGRCFTRGLLILSVFAGSAAAVSKQPGTFPWSDEIVANPQAAYTFAGWDQLGIMTGVPDEWGLRMGGFAISEFDWVASGGARPDSGFDNWAIGLHATLDAQKAFCIPGGTLGIEYLGLASGANNDAAGSVQKYTNMDAVPPRDRQELIQLWWHQRFLHDKLVFHIGKMNGAGIFGQIRVPVILGNKIKQEIDITNLLFVPAGLNPTLFGRLPAYPDTGYGAVVHVIPTNNLYVSYGIFDANGVRGIPTGVESIPDLNAVKLHIGELGYSWLLGEEKKPGRIGIGVWGQTGELFTATGAVEDGAVGYYLFGHQRLWYLHPEVDNAGVISYFQFGYTGANTQAVNTYAGAGLTGIRLVPGRPADQVSIGMAWSWLNDTPGAGASFYPDVASASDDLRASEFMLQSVYQTTFFFKLPRGFWSLTPIAGYTYIPNPGQRPDLPAAHVLSLRLAMLF